LQKLDPKQEKEEGSNLKLDLEVQQEAMKWGLKLKTRFDTCKSHLEVQVFYVLPLDPTFRGDI